MLLLLVVVVVMGCGGLWWLWCGDFCRCSPVLVAWNALFHVLGSISSTYFSTSISYITYDQHGLAHFGTVCVLGCCTCIRACCYFFPGCGLELATQTSNVGFCCMHAVRARPLLCFSFRTSIVCGFYGSMVRTEQWALVRDRLLFSAPLPALLFVWLCVCCCSASSCTSRGPSTQRGPNRWPAMKRGRRVVTSRASRPVLAVVMLLCNCSTAMRTAPGRHTVGPWRG